MRISNYTRIPWTSNSFLLIFLLICYILISILTATHQGGGGLLNQMTSVAIIAYSIYHILLAKGKCNMPVYNAAVYFMIFILLRNAVFLFQDFQTAKASIRSLFTVLFWLAPLAFSIRCFRKMEMQTAIYAMRALILITLLYLTYSLYIQRVYLTEEDIISAVNTAGSAYMLIPLIWLIFKRKSRIVLYMACLLICAFSQKRQSLLGFSVMSLFLLFDVYRAYVKSFKIMGFLLIVVAAFFGAEIFYELFGGIIERQQHFEEVGRDMDSGRSLLRAFAMEGFLESRQFDQIFGGGVGAGARYIEDRIGFYCAPHCGFIEILCGYGVVGLLLFTNIFLSLFNYIRKYPISSIVWKLLMGILSTWIISNLVSHAGRVWSIYYSITIGFIFTYFDYYQQMSSNDIKD